MTVRLSRDQPLTIAIHAIGGQGGGVLAGWLVALAEAQGWVAQSTSVPGVAQRTGATIYYIEIAKAARARPVMALMPAPGAVDLVVAAEWMEAGRAIQRGFVSPDCTTLIASTHRALSVAEKSVPGDGISDGAATEIAGAACSERFITGDFASIAQKNGSVISAALFGAIAGAGVLPFERDGFEAAISQSGIGVAASLKAFDAGFDQAQDPFGKPEVAVAKPGPMQGGSAAERRGYDDLLARLKGGFPPQVQDMAWLGLNRVVDYQDAAYGAAYLDRLDRVLALDGGGHDRRLSVEVAKYLAGAMTYPDVIRVADLKSRAARFVRVRGEVNAGARQPLSVTEYLHPRVEDLRGLLPVWLSGLAETSVMGWLLGRFAGGKRLRSDTVHGYLQLYLLAGLRRWRLGSLRHKSEMAHLAGWLENVLATVPQNYGLAVEIAKARRLIKGYSDTHSRGLGKYDRVLTGIDAVRGRKDGPDWAARLVAAALQDADGAALDGALATIAGFANKVA